MSTIIIGADLVPTESNVSLFVQGGAEALVGNELLQILSEAEFRIFNLEVPLTDKESSIPKCGPNLIAPTSTINGIRAIGADILTLANNHILDQGKQGLESTCQLLSENGIAYLGVGGTPMSAAQPYIFQCNGKKVGIYACAEHEFSIVSSGTVGANPFDPLESPDHVAALKQQCDYVIVLYHGGKEHYRYPSPDLQRTCRKLVDKGANLVVCQHSHCVGCEEKYQEGTIVYGQGNFLFDYSESEHWQTGLLVRIDGNLTVSYIPIVKHGNTVRLATEEKTKEIMVDFQQRSCEIQEDGFIVKKYREFAASMLDVYLYQFANFGIIIKVLNKLTKHRFMSELIKLKYSLKSRLAIQNYIECEAHRELLLCGIKEKQK